MYKNYGCTWKGKVADLSVHQETCEYAVGECPNKCGAKLKRGQFRALGGFPRLNKIFDGKLEEVLGDLHDELWRDSA